MQTENNNTNEKLSIEEGCAQKEMTKIKCKIQQGPKLVQNYIEA